jgi:hypothetical protein
MISWPATAGIGGVSKWAGIAHEDQRTDLHGDGSTN